MDKRRRKIISILLIIIGCTFFLSCSKEYDGPSFSIVHYKKETWGPCKQLEAVLSEIKNDYKDKVTISSIDIEDENASSDIEKYSIISTPFVVLFNDKGEEVGTFGGFKDKKEFVDILKKYGLVK